MQDLDRSVCSLHPRLIDTPAPLPPPPSQPLHQIRQSSNLLDSEPPSPLDEEPPFHFDEDQDLVRTHTLPPSSTCPSLPSLRFSGNTLFPRCSVDTHSSIGGVSERPLLSNRSSISEDYSIRPLRIRTRGPAYRSSEEPLIHLESESDAEPPPIPPKRASARPIFHSANRAANRPLPSAPVQIVKTPPLNSLQPTFGSPQRTFDKDGNTILSNDFAVGSYEGSSKQFCLSRTSSFGELEELGRGAGFHSGKSISSLGVRILQDLTLEPPRYPNRPISWASSAALPPSDDPMPHSDMDELIPPPRAKSAPLSRCSLDSQENGQESRLETQGGTVSHVLPPSQYRALPVNNPSFDLAYYLKNTGPPSPENPEEKKDVKAPATRKLGKFSKIGFRKSNNKRATSVRVAPVTPKITIPEKRSTNSPHVVQKTLKNGQKYLHISPGRGGSLDLQGKGRETIRHPRVPKPRASVTFSDEDQTLNTNDLDEWIASFERLSSDDRTRAKPIKRIETRSTAYLSSSSATTAGSVDHTDNTELTEPSSGSPERMNYKDLRGSKSWSGLGSFHKPALTERVSFDTMDTPSIEEGGSPARHGIEALRSNPPRFSTFGTVRIETAQVWKGSEQSPAAARAKGRVRLQTLKRTDDKMFGPLLEEAQIHPVDQHPAFRAAAPAPQISSSPKGDLAAEDLIPHSIACSTPPRTSVEQETGSHETSPKSSAEAYRSAEQTRKMRGIKHRHNVSIDGVVIGPARARRDTLLDNSNTGTPPPRGIGQKDFAVQSSLKARGTAPGAYVGLSPIMTVATEEPIAKLALTKQSRAVLRDKRSSKRSTATQRHMKTTSHDNMKLGEPVAAEKFSHRALPETPATARIAREMEMFPKHFSAPPHPNTSAATAVLAQMECASRAFSKRTTDAPTQTNERGPLIMISTPQSTTREIELEEKIKSLEHEKMLLEAALQAVLKAGGQISKCLCQTDVQKDTVGLSSNGVDIHG